MNKIIVVDNVIIPDNYKNIKINDNEISFNKDGDYFLEYNNCSNFKTNIIVKKNVHINLFIFINEKDINLNNNYYLEENASIVVNKFCANQNTNEINNIYLNGNDAKIRYNFSSIGKGLDKYQINIYHNFKNTNSDIYNNTVAYKNSTNLFDINSYVENGIKDCYLNQHTKIITLDDSNNKINPNMFVSENSTTAIHSSIIGTVDEETLFYLMSRGIKYEECISLITKGIILSNINASDETKEKILNIIGGVNK